MLKNKKVLIIILLYIFLIFTFCSNTFAYSSGDENDFGYYYSTFPVELLNKVKLLDEWNDNKYGCFGFHYKAWNSYRVIFIENPDFNKSCKVSSNSSYGSRFCIKLDGGNYIIYDYNLDYSLKERFPYSLNVYYEDKGNNEYLFKNIKAYDNDTLFFLPTPPPPTPLTHLAPVVEKVEMEETLKEIIQILPLILVVVVFFLGLRKALQMLSTLLHRCLIT